MKKYRIYIGSNISEQMNDNINAYLNRNPTKTKSQIVTEALVRFLGENEDMTEIMITEIQRQRKALNFVERKMDINVEVSYQILLNLFKFIATSYRQESVPNFSFDVQWKKILDGLEEVVKNNGYFSERMVQNEDFE